eukprot:gene8427-9913_t
MDDHLKSTREWIKHSVKNEDGTNNASHFSFAPVSPQDDDQADFLTREELANPIVLAKAMKTRLPRYVPILNWLRSYTRQDAIGDILSSITVAIMLVPQGLAYSILAGLPPIYGLYSGWLPLVIYAFMGSCRQLAVGPEALLSVLLGSILLGFSSNEAWRGEVIQHINYGNATEEMKPAIEAAAIGEALAMVSQSLAFLVGVISFLLGVFQFGFLGSIISRWVLSGFINAVALIIAISQLDALIGITSETHAGPYQKFWFACKAIVGQAEDHDTHSPIHIQQATIILSICCIIFLFAMRIVKQMLVKKGFPNAKYIPEIMIVVIASIVFIAITKLDAKDSNGKAKIPALGYMDGGFPIPRFPKLDMDELRSLLPQAFLIVIVGFVEATAVSKALATKHNYNISSNRELVAFGSANMLGSIFRSYPVFSSIPRTAIQDTAGSRTCLSGFLTSNLLLITCLFLTGLFTHLPKATMAAIIFVAAFGLLELHEILFLWKTRSWGDIVQFMVALLSTFILEVELGILISVGMCIFLVLRHSSSPHVYSVLGRVPGTNRFKDVAKFPEAEPIEGILLIRIDEVLYFANIGQFKQLLSEIERMMDKAAAEAGSGSTPLQSIVINVCNIPIVDASALLTLQEMVEAYHKRQVKVAFVQMSDRIKESFRKSGLYDIVTPQLIFESNYEAVTFLEQNAPAPFSRDDATIDMPATRGAFDQDEEDDYYGNNRSPGAILSDGLKMDDYSDPDSDEFITK